MQRKKYILFFVFLLLNIVVFSQPEEYIFGNENFLDSLQTIPALMSDKQSVKIDFYDNWWQSILFIVAFSLFALFSLKFKEEISKIISSFFIRSHFKQFLQQKSSVFSNLLMFFNISFFILLSVFLFSYAKTFPSGNVENIKYYVYVFLGIASFYGLKMLIALVMDKVIEFSSFHQTYSLTVRLSNVVGAIFLIFAIFIIFYNPRCSLTCYQSVVWGLLFLYFYRIIILFREFFRSRFYLFYMILYLCSVEILPIFIVISLLSID